MAAACSSLQHIFENPLPESSTLIDSLSPWSQIKSIDQPSFTELFGELRFKENSNGGGSSPSSPLPISTSSPSPSPSSSSSSSSSLSSSFSSTQNNHNHYIGRHKSSDSFSSMNSESLQLCTEGLGFESSDDVEDLKSDDNWQKRHEDPKISKFTTKHSAAPENLCGEFRRSRVSGGAFPPPISCIGKSGKPWVCFKSFRHDGRFVLKEVRIPTQEFLHACREDGRLKLQFVQPDDEILEEDDEEDDDDDKGTERV